MESRHPPFGLVVTDRACRIAYATQNARRRLARFFGRPARVNHLPRPVCRWLAEARGSRQSLVVRRGEGCLIVRRVSIPTGSMTVLSLELLPNGGGRRPAHRGLTRCEGEVWYWIAQGKTTPEIAQVLGRSKGTVS